MTSSTPSQGDNEPKKNTAALEAKQLWDQGDGVAAGKALMLGASPRQAAFLALSIFRTASKFKIKWYFFCWNLLWIESHPYFWRSAQSIFHSIRRHTLKLENKGRLCEEDEINYRYLLLAENVAKTVYNSCNPNDPFDDDSPVFAVACFFSFVVSRGSAQLAWEASDLLSQSDSPR